MKRFIIIAILISCISSVIAMETNNYKQELHERGWLYGCTPVNWSL